MIVAVGGAAIHEHAEAAALHERAAAADLPRATVERDGDLAERGEARAEQDQRKKRYNVASHVAQFSKNAPLVQSLQVCQLSNVENMNIRTS